MIYDQETGDLLVEFDTYIQNNYHNSNGVAYEPLEQGSFSSDSKQNTPFVVSLTAIKNITPDDSTKDTLDQIRDTLEQLATDSRLVMVVLQPMLNQSLFNRDSQYYQCGVVYQSMALVSIDYENNPDQLDFRPVLVFQQIRLTDTDYTDSQNNENPENNTTINNGQVQPNNSFYNLGQNNVSLITTVGG